MHDASRQSHSAGAGGTADEQSNGQQGSGKSAFWGGVSRLLGTDEASMMAASAEAEAERQAAQEMQQAAVARVNTAIDKTARRMAGLEREFVACKQKNSFHLRQEIETAMRCSKMEGILIDQEDVLLELRGQAAKLEAEISALEEAVGAENLMRGREVRRQHYVPALPPFVPSLSPSLPPSLSFLASVRPSRPLPAPHQPTAHRPSPHLSFVRTSRPRFPKQVRQIERMNGGGNKRRKSKDVASPRRKSISSAIEEMVLSKMAL